MRRFTDWAAPGRLGGIALCLTLAACQSGPSGGSGGGGSSGSGAPAAFTPGQSVEVIGVDGGPIPEGQCRDVQRTAWVTAIESVPNLGREELGPDKQQLACAAAKLAWETSAEQKCSTQFNDGQLYRNGFALPAGQAGANCDCSTSGNVTVCEVKANAQCGVEVLRTETVEACR